MTSSALLAARPRTVNERATKEVCFLLLRQVWSAWAVTGSMCFPASFRARLRQRLRPRLPGAHEDVDEKVSRPSRPGAVATRHTLRHLARARCAPSPDTTSPPARASFLIARMPTVFIDTSATVEVGPFLNGCSPKLAAAVGAPKEHVHIVLRCAQCMTWGSKLGGVDGAPHTAQIRVVCGDDLSAEQKAKVVAGVGGMLSKFVPSASTQFCFDVVGTANLFIDGACLSGMAPPPKVRLRSAARAPASATAAATARSLSALPRAGLKTMAGRGRPVRPPASTERAKTSDLGVLQRPGSEQLHP